jgi:hypothetical protein
MKVLLYRVIFPLTALFCLTGCDTSGYVTDTSGMETKVINMRLLGEKNFTVIYGESVKGLPLEACGEITIFNDNTKTLGGKLYFPASVALRDGAKMDARKKDNTPATYIQVGDVLCGESHLGRFSIGLTNVSKIRFVKE